MALDVLDTNSYIQHMQGLSFCSKESVLSQQGRHITFMLSSYKLLYICTNQKIIFRYINDIIFIQHNIFEVVLPTSQVLNIFVIVFNIKNMLSECYSIYASPNIKRAISLVLSGLYLLHNIWNNNVFYKLPNMTVSDDCSVIHAKSWAEFRFL